MISEAEEGLILSRAYIPEHIPSLMSSISGGEPFLGSGYLSYSGEDWLIFVGYPLEGDVELQEALGAVLEKASPRTVFLIAPHIPSSAPCLEKKGDWYYTLDLRDYRIKKSLRYRVRRALRALRVETGEISDEHSRLVEEFLEEEKPEAHVRELFRRMPEYASRHDKCVVLNALDHEDRLAAFFLVDVSPRDFAAYLIGCYSRSNPVQGASDLLFSEMIALARKEEKKRLNLGLGVSPGIKKFKEKWGGSPTIRYESCSWDADYEKAMELLKLWKY